MDIFYTIEEKYLQAVAEVSYGETTRGLQLLNEIIANDPFYARAHFQLGKLHYYEVKDYQTAGFHFKTCIELEPSFPDVYFHFLSLVVFLRMDDQVTNIVEKALTTRGVNIAGIYELQALFFEKKKQWAEAANTYKKAFFEVTDKKQKENIEESLQRIKEKMKKNRAYQYDIVE